MAYTIEQAWEIVDLISRKRCIACKGIMDIPYKPTIPLCKRCRCIYLNIVKASEEIQRNRRIEKKKYKIYPGGKT